MAEKGPEIGVGATDLSQSLEDGPATERTEDSGRTEHPGTIRASVRNRRWALLAGLFFALLVSDLWSKHWAQVDLQSRPRKRVELVKGWLSFSYVRNPAGAWGFMRGMKATKRHYLLLAVSLAAVGILVLLLVRSRSDQLWLRISLTCILAGAVGNIVDRVRWRYVVDFIDWHKGFKWPTFNVADIAITVGVVMMAVEIFLDRPEPEDHQPDEKSVEGEDPDSPSDQPPEGGEK